MVLYQPSWGERSTRRRSSEIEGDYNATTPDGAEVTSYIATAEQLLAAVKVIISRSPPAPSD
jgi:hypothetical protein